MNVVLKSGLSQNHHVNTTRTYSLSQKCLEYTGLIEAMIHYYFCFCLKSMFADFRYTHKTITNPPTNRPTKTAATTTQKMSNTIAMASDFFQEHWEFPQIKSTALFVHSIYSLMVFIYFYMVPSRSMWAVFWRRIKDENKNIGIWNKQRKSYSVQA